MKSAFVVMPDKICPICKKNFNRTIRNDGKIEPPSVFKTRKTCGSDKCKQQYLINFYREKKQ